MSELTFQTLFRGRFSLVKEGVLTNSQFILYEYGLSIADWDENRIGSTFGTFKESDKELAAGLGWSHSTIWRHKNTLIHKNLFIERDDRIQVRFFYTTLVEKAFKLVGEKYEQLEEAFPDLKNFISLLQGDFSFLKSELVKYEANKNSILDIKDTNNDGYNKKDVQEESKKGRSKNREKYQMIVEELDLQHTTENDLAWIDKDISKRILDSKLRR